MHDLTYALKRLAERYREGSYATQANRKNMLMLFGEQLAANGYKQMHAPELKGRHINRLLALWREQGVAPRTMENRLSVLRWWAKHIDNPGVLAKGNAPYGIPKRATVATASKARELPVDKLVRVRNAHVRMSLALQRAFGLRREEALKIKPHQADRGDKLVLQGSWCKGGRAREVPIRTLAQREVLDRAKALVKLKSASLIPADKTYAQHLHSYESQCARAGLDKMHGLRHAYAQDRFLELTGFPCPVMGGPTLATMTPAQVEADRDARVIISAELGHGREAITTAYLGR
jgi:site-specific recombinase XerD